METFSRFLAAAFGAALGAAARYAIGYSFLSKIFAPFPFATFFINVSGSFLIGLTFTLICRALRSQRLLAAISCSSIFGRLHDFFDV